MSWFSDLAKGAEALLEKVDQSTASALQKEKDASNASNPSFSVSEIPDGKESMPDIHPQMSTDLRQGTVQQMPEKGQGSRVSSIKTVPKPPSSKAVKKKTDEQLFEFLNSGPNSIGSIDQKAPNFTSTPVKHKPTESVKTTSPPKPIVTTLEKSEAIEIENTVYEVKENIGNAAMAEPKQMIEAMEDKVDGKKESSVVAKPPTIEFKERDDRVSNLQLENRLLKGEITSLNEELANSMRRLKEAEEGVKHLELKLDHAQNQMAHQDRIVRGIEEKERDLNEALKAKDSQLAVLRVRMQEADDVLQSKTEMLQKLTTDNERILKDHTDSTGLQSVALDSFKEKLEEKEKEHQTLQADFSKAQNEVMELREKLQSEQLQMAESVKALQLKVTEEKAKTKDLDHNLRVAKDSADSAQRDLKEYKDKATRILQAKEKLITSLKQGSVGTEASPVVFTELEEVKQEREFLREELQQAKYKWEQLRVEFYEAEQQSQSEMEEHQTLVENLEKCLQEEQTKREHLEEELTRNSQELALLKEDLQRQKTKTVSILQERDAEIQRLSHQMNLKSSLSPSQEELENRVHAITDNLIQKQTLIERLSTEKNSLSLQLERLEQQYRDVQQHVTKSNVHLRHNHSHFDIEDSDEVHSSSLASIMPARVTRSKRWKSTVNVIDKFSIRLGVFLRRYPIARLFVILYMFILHLWVTIVLLTYQPEIHSKNSKLPGVGR